MIKKNDIIPLTITDMTGQGSGIGRVDGMAVFVPMTAVGDVIDARILKVKKSYAFAKVERITTPSENRIESDCECFAKCGGCVYRHISYSEELQIKQKRVYDAVTRIGGIDGFAMHDIIGCSEPNGYRNKTQLPVGRGTDGEVIMGFYGSHSHRIVPCENCSLQPDEFNEIARLTRKWIKDSNISTYDEQTHKGLLRHLYMRKGFDSHEIMVCLVINGNTVPNIDSLVSALTDRFGNISSIVLNINKEKTNVILGQTWKTVYGSDCITDTLCGLTFNISPLSFYQINHDQTQRLYAKAKEYAHLTGNEFLIDLYCGAGTIGLSMADKCSRVLGVEIIPEAVQNARENAAQNGITNAEFICDDASGAAEKLAKSGERPDVVVIDPPRKGCSGDVINAIVKMSPERVVYVSCEPETLARDLALFDELGYKTSDVTPVDMFPRTASVETVVQLSRKKPDDTIDIDLELDELDITSAESKATYQEIKNYVLKEFGLKVSTLYISQVKQKCGLDIGKNYNVSRKEEHNVPKCPEDKERAIRAALKYFGMI